MWQELSLALQHPIPSLGGLGTDTVLFGELTGTGTPPLRVSELLGRPAQQMTRILDSLSPFGKGEGENWSFCRAPTPTPPGKLPRDYFCVTSFYPGGCK